jgi:hypothetical protein
MQDRKPTEHERHVLADLLERSDALSTAGHCVADNPLSWLLARVLDS